MWTVACGVRYPTPQATVAEVRAIRGDVHPCATIARVTIASMYAEFAARGQAMVWFA